MVIFSSAMMTLNINDFTKNKGFSPAKQAPHWNLSASDKRCRAHIGYKDSLVCEPLSCKQWWSNNLNKPLYKALPYNAVIFDLLDLYFNEFNCGCYSQEWDKTKTKKTKTIN